MRSLTGLAASGPAEAADDVVETDVEIKTPDGTCAFTHPKSGSHPGVLIWPDGASSHGTGLLIDKPAALIS